MAHYYKYNFVSPAPTYAIVKEELNLAPWQFSIVMILLRWVAPLGILVVFANSIGLLNLS